MGLDRGCSGRRGSGSRVGTEKCAKRPVLGTGVITPRGAFPPKTSCSFPAKWWNQSCPRMGLHGPPSPAEMGLLALPAQPRPTWLWFCRP